MKKPRLSRRDFLRLSAGATAGTLLAACAPRVVKETVEVEKVVTKEVEKVVTKEVEKVVTPTPAPGWEGTIEVYLGDTSQPEVARGEGLEPLHAARELGDEWEALHPGVKLDFIEGPGPEGIEMWVKARQAAGTMPDICQAHDNWLNRDIGFGYWISVDPWINTSNPYIPEGEEGRERWRDAFIAGFDARNLMIDQRYYGVPQYLTGVQIYCNLDILEKAGVDFEGDIINPRWTFDSMLDISARIKEAGFTPWAFMWNHPYWNWIQTSTLAGWLKSTGRWEKLDTNGDDFVTSLERFEAILRGDWAADTEEMRAMHQLAEDWMPYWAEGYLGLTFDDIIALFARGEAAFMWNGTWHYPTLLNDPERTFEFAIARLPLCMDRFKTIGKGGPTQYPGGAYDTLALTSTAGKRGTAELCIDFIKYFTSCDSQSRVCKEHGGVIPVVKCAEGNPELEQFRPAPDETFLQTIHMRSMNFDYGETYWRITSEWLGGTMTYDQAMAQFQEVMEEYAKDAIERVGET